MIDIRILNTASEFAMLEPRWNGIVGQSATATCHSTFEWLFTWWKYFGIGGRQLLLVAAYEDNTLVGMGPFYVGGEAAAEPRSLHFLGQGLSDYADVIAPSNRVDIMEALWSAILEYKGAWNSLDLEEVPNQSMSVAVLDRKLALGHLAATWHQTVRCPYLPIRTSWQEFYNTMGKGFRHEVRNKQNRWTRLAQERGGLAEVTYVGRSDADSVLVDEIIALSAKRQLADGHRSPFLVHPDVEFLREVLPLMGRQNQLRIGELRSNATLLAFVLSFFWKGITYTWNTQYDPDLTEFSLGRIVLVRVAEQAFSEGCTELNFMRGEEPYKFEWTSAFRTNLALRSLELIGQSGA